MTVRLSLTIAAALGVVTFAAAPLAASAFDRVPDGPPANAPISQCFVADTPTTPSTYTCQIVGYTLPSSSGGTAVASGAAANPAAPDHPPVVQGNPAASDHYLDGTSAFH